MMPPYYLPNSTTPLLDNNPTLDVALGVVMVICSVVAVLGNGAAIALMTRVFWRGRSNFTTVIYVNIAFAGLVSSADYNSRMFP